MEVILRRSDLKFISGKNSSSMDTDHATTTETCTRKINKSEILRANDFTGMEGELPICGGTWAFLPFRQIAERDKRSRVWRKFNKRKKYKK